MDWREIRSKFIYKYKIHMLLLNTNIIPYIQSAISSISPVLPVFIMNTWIAPHGATDLIHAFHYNTTNILTTSYYSTLALGGLCHVLHQDVIFYGIFGICSFFHFYEDWKLLKNPIAAFALTGAIMTTFVNSSWLPFYLYMTFHHVPFHYIQVWDILCKYKIPTVLLLSSTAFTMYFFTHLTGVLQPSVTDYSISLTKSLMEIDGLGIWISSIIIGHIVYGIRFNRIQSTSIDSTFHEKKSKSPFF